MRKRLWIEIRFLPKRIKMDLVRVLNFLRLPGLVRECYYEAGICKVRIRVQYGVLFTIISVDGLDIYFSRLTGKIDGVGGFVSPCNARSVYDLRITR